MAKRGSPGGGGSTDPFPTPATQEQLVQAVFGWMTLFVLLIVGSDVPGFGDLVAAIAWLLLLSIVIIYGPSAFTNLQKFVAPQENTTP